MYLQLALIIVEKQQFVKKKIEKRIITMDKDKVLNCQKYYIFKIRDIVHNSFHILEEKRMECLIQYLELTIDTYDEYRKALDPSKLKRSYEGLIEGLCYQMENHPFKKLSVYKNDFSYLQKLIQLEEKERDKELHNIHSTIVCLKKKLCSYNIIEQYIECLQCIDVFSEIDFWMESLVSDLLYKGYSLDYLIEWFKGQQNLFMSNDQDVSIINNLMELDGQPKGHTIYIKFTVKNISHTQAALELLGKKFKISRKTDYNFGNMWKGKDYYVASKMYQALDVTKAVSMAAKEFGETKELFDMWQGGTNNICDDSQYGWEENSKLNLVAVGNTDNVKMLGYVDSYYKKQINRFLEMKENLENEDIKVLERVLYTLNTAKTYKIQNRFLNFWSALEYILYPFPRFTIIEKARVVVPEAFSLFYIKNKINIFWWRLTHYIKTRNEDAELSEVIQFVEECRELQDDGYDTQKLIGVFQDEERIKKIVNILARHMVLNREATELHMLITNPNKAMKEIERYYEGIRHDLNYVYRLRNQLIHSTNGMDDYLEHVSMRLYRYVNSILSTILYYKEKNSEYTITDVLNSIDATYQKYVDTWSEKKQKGKDMNPEQRKELNRQEAYCLVRPPYLFIE